MRSRIYNDKLINSHKNVKSSNQLFKSKDITLIHQSQYFVLVKNEYY